MSCGRAHDHSATNCSKSLSTRYVASLTRSSQRRFLAADLRPLACCRRTSGNTRGQVGWRRWTVAYGEQKLFIVVSCGYCPRNCALTQRRLSEQLGLLQVFYGSAKDSYLRCRSRVDDARRIRFELIALCTTQDGIITFHKQNITRNIALEYV